MVLEERLRGESVVVDLHGPVDRDAGDFTHLLAHLRGLANRGCTSLVLNVRELATADSMTVGALARAYISANRAGVTLRLEHVSPQLRQLLGITKLDRVIEVLD